MYYLIHIIRYPVGGGSTTLIKDKQFFSVSEFAELFNIHKKTLYYYDEIGLFKPEYVNKNGYRYYSHSQIYDFHVLLAIKNLHLSLEDTKNYVYNRTPENMVALMDKKVTELDDEIKRLINLKNSITERVSLIKTSLNVPIDEIQIKYVNEQYLRLEPIEVPENQDTNYLTWHDLFLEDNKHHLNESSYGQVILQKNLTENTFKPDFILIEAIDDEAKKNAFIKSYGKYVIGRKVGKVLHSASLYEKLMKFIKENNLEIIGNSYEFFIIDGSFSSDPNNRVLEIQIQIK